MIKDKLRSLLLNIFRHCNVHNNRIVFSNFFGRGFGDNPKYIALEIHNQGLPYDMYWAVNKGEEKTLPQWLKPIRVHSLKSFYIFATSRIIIYNAKGLLPYIKKKKQYYIQTWHGCLGFKFIEGEVKETLSEDYCQKSKYDSSITDVFLAGSSQIKDTVSKCFWYNHEIWESGEPRSDIFFHITSDQKEKIKVNLGISNDVKILLYAPTFRDNGSIDGYKVDIEKTLIALESKTNNRWIALIRLHPAALKYSNIFTYSNKVINVSSYPDPQDLSIVCDAMLTDYSSIVLDAFLQEKPVFLYTCDYDDYVAKDRPIRDIYYHLPCKRNNNNEELFLTIRDFDYCDYKERLKQFMKIDFVCYDDGHASERVVDRIKKVIETNYQSPYYIK